MTVDPQNAQPDVRRAVGLAMSGGGSRACLFALGALLYLNERRECVHIREIASVSGGSITNALIAYLAHKRGGLEDDEFRSAAANLARLVAGRPLLFWAVGVFFLIAQLAWIVPSSVAGSNVSLTVAVILLSSLLVVALGPRAGGALWAWWGMWAGSALFVSAALWVVIWPASGSGWWRVGIGVLLAVAFSQRSILAGMALDHLLEASCSSDDGKHLAVQLSDLAGSSVRHVFCATEMHSGSHFYFLPDAVLSRGLGIGTPGKCKVRTAVQTSAGFPFAFPYRAVRATPYGFALDQRSIRSHTIRFLLLSDGGIYDNLGESWYLERSELLDPINEELLRQGKKLERRLRDLKILLEDPAQAEVAYEGRRLSVAARDELEQIVASGAVTRDEAEDAASDPILREWWSLSVQQRVLQDKTLLVKGLRSTSSPLLLLDASAPRRPSRLRWISIPLNGEAVSARRTISTLYENTQYSRTSSLRARLPTGDTAALASASSMMALTDLACDWAACLADPYEADVSDKQARELVDYLGFKQCEPRGAQFQPSDEYDEAVLATSEFFARERRLQEQRRPHRFLEREWSDFLRIRTTLNPLGTTAAGRALWAGYVAASIACYLSLDSPLPDELPEVERFESLDFPL